MLRWLWNVLQGNRLQASINALVGILQVAISLAQVWAVQHAIEVAEGVSQGSLYKAVGLMALLTLALFGLQISNTWIKNTLGIRAQNRMQQRLLDRILHSEWHGKEKLHSGDVINRLELDVANVVNFLTEVVPGTISVLLLFFGAFTYLFSMDSMLALITIAITPIVLILSRIYIQRMRSLSREVRSSDSKVQSILQETIQNRMLIKTLESDDIMIHRLEETQSELRHNVVKRTIFSIISNFIVNFGFSIGFLVAFLWAALRLAAGTLSFGGMTAFLQLVNRIQNPARNLSRLLPQFVSVFTAAERLMELEADQLEEQGSPIPLSQPCGIRLENVSYQYDHNIPILSSINFDFAPGTCTAVLGETGAGKTTLIRLILALLRPQQGRITIYDHYRQQSMSPRLRCNLAYVPQGNTLMSGSIRDNLRLGRLEASEAEMMAALHDACADFVGELPDGLDTLCTEKGGGLSEGQAQRIAIARALLRNRPVMIFDEATSALDPETEERLLKNILGKHNKTIIFITHRNTVANYCDKILEIHTEKNRL